MKRREGILARAMTVAVGCAVMATLVLPGQATAEANSNRGYVAHEAPDWPFRGAVHYYGSGLAWISAPDAETGARYGIRYRSSTDGAVTELDLGTGDNLEFCGPGEMFAGPLGIWFDYPDGTRTGHWTHIYVPWGDAAYPMYTRSLLARTFTDAWQSDTEIGGRAIGVRNADYGGWLTLAFDTEERHYRLVDLGLYRGDVHPSEFRPPPEPPPDWEIGRTVDMSHSDGVHFGINVSLHEDICGGRQTYVFSVESGEFVGCGWGYLGPIFIAPQDVLDSSPSPSFPVDAYWHDPLRGCESAFPMDALLDMTDQIAKSVG